MKILKGITNYITKKSNLIKKAPIFINITNLLLINNKIHIKYQLINRLFLKINPFNQVGIYQLVLCAACKIKNNKITLNLLKNHKSDNHQLIS